MRCGLGLLAWVVGDADLLSRRTMYWGLRLRTRVLGAKAGRMLMRSSRAAQGPHWVGRVVGWWQVGQGCVFLLDEGTLKWTFFKGVILLLG